MTNYVHVLLQGVCRSLDLVWEYAMEVGYRTCAGWVGYLVWDMCRRGEISDTGHVQGGWDI